MKMGLLEEYTKQKELIGQNSMQILERFLQYSGMCVDPENVYAYMEQKSICVYLTHYWVAKAEYHADTGDYRGAFECLSEGQSRSDIITEDYIDFSLIKNCLLGKMILKMKRHHVSSRKRTADQYQLLNGNRATSDDHEIERALRLYDVGFTTLKEELERAWAKKCQSEGRIKSWMATLFQQRQENLKKIQQRMSISIRPSTSNHKQSDRHKSMTTPFKKKGLLKLNKTVDSVQLLKKKRKTGELTSSKDEDQGNQNQQRQDGAQSLSLQSRRFHSVPIGRSFSTAKRVTFNKKKDEKLRGQSQKRSMRSSVLKKKSSIFKTNSILNDFAQEP